MAKSWKNLKKIKNHDLATCLKYMKNELWFFLLYQQNRKNKRPHQGGLRL